MAVGGPDYSVPLGSIDTKLTQIVANLKRIADALEKLAAGQLPKP